MINRHTLLQPRRPHPPAGRMVRLAPEPQPAGHEELQIVDWLYEYGSLPRLALVEMLVRHMLHDDLRAAAVDVGLWGRVVYEHQATRVLDAMEGRVVVSESLSPTAA